MVNIGDTMRFVPGWRYSQSDIPKEKREKQVSGKVVYVNRPHKQFCVKYRCGGTYMKETFKFSQIGTDIYFAGGR